MHGMKLPTRGMNAGGHQYEEMPEGVEEAERRVGI